MQTYYQKGHPILCTNNNSYVAQHRLLLSAIDTTEINATKKSIYPTKTKIGQKWTSSDTE